MFQSVFFLVWTLFPPSSEQASYFAFWNNCLSMWCLDFTIKPLVGISFQSFSFIRSNFANNSHNFLKEIRVHYIDVAENFLVWEDWLCKAYFIIIDSIVFKWTEVYVFVSTIYFKFRSSSCAKISSWQDKPTLITPFWETLEGGTC